MWIITNPLTLIIGVVFIVVMLLEGFVWLITQWWLWVLIIGGGVLVAVSRK